VSSPIDAAQRQPVSPQRAIEVAPNAVAAVAHPRHDDDGRTLVFVGSLAFEPNEDAVLWFAEEILPLVRRPGLRFIIAGTNPSERIQQLTAIPGVEVTGWVPDLTPIYQSATLSVTPLRSGGGTRIKILESAANDVPVVSTAFGAAGLGLIDGRDLWLADTPAAFADAITGALDRPHERRSRAEAARRWVADRHDRSRVIGQPGPALRTGMGRRFLGRSELCAGSRHGRLDSVHRCR
jgi:glycosyltransferase involved in cell wall biosynthesis